MKYKYKYELQLTILKAQAGPNGSNRGKSVTLGSHHGEDDSESTDWYRNSTRRPFTKIEFPKFQGGDPRGWILKAKKYFRYHKTPDESKMEIASMYLEGDTLDLFAWISAEHNHLYWEELAPYKNTDNKMKKRVARVHDLPDHYLLGVFLCGLKDELKVDVRIHKPRNVFNAVVERDVEANLNEYEECINQQDMAEISFHTILGKAYGTTMKVEGTLEGRKVLILVYSGLTHNFISTSLVKQLGLKVSNVPSFGVRIRNRQIIQCNQLCRGLSLVLPGLKIIEDYFSFSIGGVDLVLGIKWLASLNTVQANWNEMLMIFYVNGNEYKLQGVTSVTKTDVSLQSYSKLSNVTSDSSRTLVEIPAGKESQGAGALSKRPQHADFLALAMPVNMDFLNLQDALINDPYTKNTITSIIQDPTSHPEFSLSDNKLFYQNRLVISDDSFLRKKLLSECQDSLTGGHGSYLKTLKRLSENLFWPKMKNAVKVFVQNCLSKFFAWVEYSFNTGYHTSIKTTPFKSVYGRDPPPLNLYVQDYKRRELSFEVGDVVLLRIQPFRQRSLFKRKFEKLSPLYFGPYTVTRRVGLVAYELALPADSKVIKVVAAVNDGRLKTTMSVVMVLKVTSAEISLNLDVHVRVVRAHVRDHL
uniref:Retrotransposon Gag domain, retroviral aspartyl protease n=1 Tax=Tanacetum cinerariifolium TaxID=118510 RepID=A0A6L2N3D5_TANCI|nr:retrotransposon Gag domain, retroviral aspartyl protease [Tanacetum cinerariifolium]